MIHPVSAYTVAWLRVFFLFAPFFRFISGLVSLVRSCLFYFILFSDLFILPHYLALRRNRSSARYFHWHSRCESRKSAFWLTTDPPWHFIRAVYWSVTFGHLYSTSITSIITGGFFSGNTAVIYSVLGEITDSTNQAIAFPVFALAWPFGSIIG